MKNSAPIGFLDSGIGGSTVLIKTLSVLPNEKYVFFSDSANCPYGDKSDGEIIERCDKIVSFLIKDYGCKAIVIACNTASAKASAYLREKYSLPIIAIEPAYKMVYDQNPDGFTLVMATKGTKNSINFIINIITTKQLLLPASVLRILLSTAQRRSFAIILIKRLMNIRAKRKMLFWAVLIIRLQKRKLKTLWVTLSFLTVQTV